MGQLLYRYPGRERVVLQGDFAEVSCLEEVRGFVLSDFYGKRLYQFEENYSAKSNLPDIPYVIDEVNYFKNAKSFLDDLIGKELEKAIFSRVKKGTSILSAKEIFENLEATYPDAFVYLIESMHLGVWVGASPEKLCLYDSGKLTTVSLAGTLPLDSLNSWTEKEYREQTSVTDFIVSEVSKYSNEVKVDSVIEVVAGPVRHLSQTIIADLNEIEMPHVIRRIHPTPAVSGFPREKALDLIEKHELHDRSLYAGFLGEYNSQMCALYVNLRCAQIDKKDVYCFVGGGFNSQSVVEKEWEETENKAKTILNILQNK